MYDTILATLLAVVSPIISYTFHITSNHQVTFFVDILLSIITLPIPGRFGSLRRVSRCRKSHALSHYWAPFFSFMRRAPKRLSPNFLFLAENFVYLQVLFCIRTLEISRSLPSHTTPWPSRVSAHTDLSPPSRHFPRDHYFRFSSVCRFGARG